MIWWKIGGVVVLLGALLAGFKLFTNHYENIGYEQCKTEDQAANLKALQEYAKRVKKAEEERDANQLTIDRLMSQSRSVRVHLPTACQNGSTKDQNGGTGVLPDRMDAAFARFQERTTELIKRCDEMNLEAIWVNEAPR